MKRGKALALTLGGLAILGCVYLGLLIPRGFSARDEPSSLERVLARAARNLSIPSRAAKEANPWNPTPDNLKEAREIFTDRCTTCHGHDGRGRTDVGRNMYPKPPDLTCRERKISPTGKSTTSFRMACA